MAQTTTDIEDSINDRDFDSSVARIASSLPPPTDTIKEDVVGEEQKDTTTFE